MLMVMRLVNYADVSWVIVDGVITKYMSWMRFLKIQK